MILQDLKNSGEAPEWYTNESYKTVSKGYLLQDETPRQMYKRVADTAAKYLGMPEMADLFFSDMWNNHLCPASPVLSNTGTDRGLNISCFANDVGDSLDYIYDANKELGKLTAEGGGVGMTLTRIRAKGTPIRGGRNGVTDSIIPWAKMYDSAIIATSQGTVRRGSASINLDVKHGDFFEFVRMRRPEGDVNRQCLNLHHCAVIDDEFMNGMLSGNKEYQSKWVEILTNRLESGEPYIMYKDNVNKSSPLAYKNNNLEVIGTNICSEITLFTDPEHTFVCCLSSLNIQKYNEWKNTDVPYRAILFLNGILNEFIEKAGKKKGFEKAVRSAVKGRAIGLGVLGYHTYLQENMIPFESFDAMMANAEIFKFINENTLKASKDLAVKFGEPEWMKGTGEYNSHRIAVAPTRSNSIISGDVSAGIEPIIANAYVDKTAKGTFIRRSKTLAKVLTEHQMDNEDIWKSISSNNGSVQHLDLPQDIKDVFKTAFEINQISIINQAAQRQKFICQSQSLNLFYPADVDAKKFHEHHVQAWKLGVKTLYYCRSSRLVNADSSSKNDDCKACEA